MSAIFSKERICFSLLPRIDKKENKLLPTNNIQQTPVNSSITDTSLNFDILSDVKTTRQKPNKLEEVFKICWELLLDMIDIYID